MRLSLGRCSPNLHSYHRVLNLRSSQLVRVHAKWYRQSPCLTTVTQYTCSRVLLATVYGKWRKTLFGCKSVLSVDLLVSDNNAVEKLRYALLRPYKRTKTGVGEGTPSKSWINTEDCEAAALWRKDIEGREVRFVMQGAAMDSSNSGCPAWSSTSSAVAVSVSSHGCCSC